jgi:hypothetical protein
LFRINQLKLPEISRKRDNDNLNVGRIYLGAGNMFKHSMKEKAGKRNHIKISFKSNALKKLRNLHNNDGSFSDPEKKTPRFKVSQSLDPEEFKSAFSKKSRNQSNIQQFTFNGGNEGSVSDRPSNKRKNHSNSILDRIQNKINNAIKQTQEVKHYEVPKDFGKIEELKPAKEIKPVIKQEYEPIKEEKLTRNIELFKDKGYALSSSYLEPKIDNLDRQRRNQDQYKSYQIFSSSHNERQDERNEEEPVHQEPKITQMESQRNHLQPYSPSKFNLRYSRPQLIGIDEIFSLDKPTSKHQNQPEISSKIVISPQNDIENKILTPLPSKPLSPTSKLHLQNPSSSINYVPSYIKDKIQQAKASSATSKKLAFSSAKLEHYDIAKEEKKYELSQANKPPNEAKKI